ncbi:conserved hypothetical protein [Talaromyces stipitatus ATCC 10500]|uniref:Uncharacterized protein n=1 Tax=Talaromyces stipitatus (strain ATCC 10500 / CBS 375.48 / QM 6759 / NRRL 1006) TaxID=441959 RepID=B8LXA7_TALSN|nr:uncharacterized protein TSTA_066380 [Talaromyces stipitatus ATCC 10500]EED23188.1 conserved hypothetical protein [Talaromyces stipitatus ATCC 10500]
MRPLTRHYHQEESLPATFCDHRHPMHTERSIRSRKRSLSEQIPADAPPEQLLKKQKVKHPSGSLLPAAFWDNLSKVWLTHNALRELDRRNTQISAIQATRSSRPVTSKDRKDIRRFARQGGPDLSELRGYPPPTMKSHRPYRIQKRSVSASRGSSTSRSTKPSTTKSSGPYDRDFHQHLIDHGIFPHRYRFPDGHMPSKPGNWDNILARLAQPRPSLSPSRFADEDFEEFLQMDTDASKEKQVTENVIPFIEGKNPDSKCIGGGIPFRNLDHLTDGTLVPGNPDRYHGARPEQLDRRIRIELSDQIVPSTQHDLPIAPNFFLAAKGPDGSASVAKRQACYDGALGARGMHSLQEYGKDEPVFDNNAYTISSIYHDGTLKMFTSHPSRSTTANRTEYYMTQIKGWSMTSDPDAFREGATWYRNGRDWAKEQRDDAINRASEKAAQSTIEPTAVNTSFSTVCEISSTESECITEQSYFSFNGTNTTETHSLQSTRSLSPKPA